MKQEKKIRESLDFVRQHNIRICRGYIFDWTKPGPEGIPIASGTLPTACDATGAVLLNMSRDMSGGWLKDVCKFLEADAQWMFRFWQGWGQNKQISLISIDCFGIERIIKDDVSLFGMRLMKEYVL